MNVFSGWRERNCYFGRVQIGRSREVHPLLRTAIISCRKSTSNSCDEVACVQEEVGGNDDDDGGGGGGGVVGLSELLLGGSFPTASLPTIVSPGSDPLKLLMYQNSTSLHAATISGGNIYFTANMDNQIVRY